jgi:hypothetical protein
MKDAMRWRRMSSTKKPSTACSEEHESSTQRPVQRGWEVNQARTLDGLCAA